MPNTSREWKNIWKTVRTSSHPNVAYSDPSAHVSAKSFISLFRILHRRPVLLLTSWIASTHFLFTLWPREKERQRTLRVPRIEQPRLGCSIFRRRTNVSLLRFSVTDGISFNEIFSFARLIYFPVNRMSIVFSLPLLNFRDRNCIVSLFHRWSINFNKFSWNERIVTV